VAAIGKNSDLEGAVAISLATVRLVQGDLHQDGGFVFRDVKYAEQPVVDVAFRRLRHGIGFSHVGIVDEAGRALKARDRDFLFRGRRRIIIELVDRDGDAAAVGHECFHLLLIDQSERLGLCERRVALGIPEHHLELHPAPVAIEGRIHLACRQFHSGPVKRRRAASGLIHHRANSDDPRLRSRGRGPRCIGDEAEHQRERRQRCQL
jgi:hypothetical protein